MRSEVIHQVNDASLVDMRLGMGFMAADQSIYRLVVKLASRTARLSGLELLIPKIGQQGA